MKLLLSRFGGELKPMDVHYQNALFAYDSSQSVLLKRAGLPTCGELDVDFNPKFLSIISFDKKMDRYERDYRS